ncbi:hypothetical protein [Agromyces agglutinans]|nr:hypothetical protein [Agromyces agglutinans]
MSAGWSPNRSTDGGEARGRALRAVEHEAEQLVGERRVVAEPLDRRR